MGYGPDSRHIAELAKQYETDQILCGLPRNMDGTQGFQADKVRQFAAQLEALGLTVFYYDERMTTLLAEDALLEADMRRADRKKKVDMLAAVIILQSYLDARAAQAAADTSQEADEPEDDGILEMVDEDGTAIRFYLTARIRYAQEDYVLLTCAQDAGEIAQDESFIMRCITDDAGNPCYQSLEDEALIEAVYEAYLSEQPEA